MPQSSKKSPREELDARGYCVIPLVTKEEVQELLRDISELKPDDNFAPSANSSFEKTYHLTFLDTNFEYKRRAKELITETFGEKIKAILPDFRILDKNFFIKPPGTGELNVHRNWTFVRDQRVRTFTVWCPLVDVDETNGTIQLVTGSHRFCREVVSPTVATFFEGFQSAIIDEYSTPIEMKAGEALIFDDQIIHWSGNNMSDKPRPAVVMACVPVDEETVFYFSDMKPGSTLLDVYKIDYRFFDDFSALKLANRPQGLESYGTFELRDHRPISYEEFVDLKRRYDKGLERSEMQSLSTIQDVERTFFGKLFDRFLGPK